MAQQAPSDLILMAGQSNMAGHKVGVDDLADTERGLIEGARIWADGAWVPLAVDAGYQKRGFGPELSFARQWQDQTGGPLSIVKLAKGGSYLSRGWSAEGRGGRSTNVWCLRCVLQWPRNQCGCGVWCGCRAKVMPWILRMQRPTRRGSKPLSRACGKTSACPICRLSRG
ncbi:hypothetical protein DA792_17460 [Celeribacter baekdonensis]|uniref:Sialate O-acetylesterase domain-containing protein n=1 Tax=Celeribacter baekdonensis TaxID=875171 RepID=A0A2R4M627_9RHOB|nr:hypothetical protein DA792_17460 [Celeribacter baekdonensis]